MATEESISTLKVKGVFAPEPRHADEYGWNAHVGFNFNDARMGKVTRIEARKENMGTYGLLFFDVYCTNDEGEEHLVASFNAAKVEVVTYFTPGKDY
jgi:hypothetical protein